MSLKDDLQKNLIEAIKSKDEVKTSTLRMLKAAMMKFEVSGTSKKDATDDEIMKLIEKEVKQRKDSIDAYEKAGRPELAEKERSEMEILQGYLPAQLSDEELEQMVSRAISQTGAVSKADFGKIMGTVMAQTKGRADGNRVKMAVEKLLK